MGFESLGKKYQDGAGRADSDKILEVLVGNTACIYMCSTKSFLFRLFLCLG